MRRLTLTATLAALLLVLAGGPAAAGPTCSDLGDFAVVHGQHVVRDYVTGGQLGATWPPTGAGHHIAGKGAAVPGGPGPGFHFDHGFAPGASFCLGQSRSPGFHF